MPNPSPLEDQRQHLVMLAYRMLGTVSDAEDVVQDTFLRWQRAGEPKLHSPRAWLTRTCTHLCIDRLKEARRHRETYVGEWLPEPLSTEVSTEVDETISMALLVAVQRLNPAERAALLLHDVFGYEFEEVAEILDRESAGCRQLAARARRRLRDLDGKYEQERAPNPSEVERVTQAFFRAVRSGDLSGIRAVLTEDVVLHSDGGGHAPAARRPIHGADAVARFLHRVLKGDERFEFRPTWLNGSPAALIYEEGLLVTAFLFSVRFRHGGTDDQDSGIAALFAQRNPDKLSRLA